MCHFCLWWGLNPAVGDIYNLAGGHFSAESTCSVCEAPGSIPAPQSNLMIKCVQTSKLNLKDRKHMLEFFFLFLSMYVSMWVFTCHSTFTEATKATLRPYCGGRQPLWCFDSCLSALSGARSPQCCVSQANWHPQLQGTLLSPVFPAGFCGRHLTPFPSFPSFFY